MRYYITSIAFILSLISGCSSAHHHPDLATLKHQIRTTCTNYTVAGAKHVECIDRVVSY